MSVIKRGFDVAVPDLSVAQKKRILDEHGIPEGINLLFAGRVSRDKNIDFLIEVYQKVLKTNPEVNLVIAGNGPDLERMKRKMHLYDRVFFLGRIPNETLLKLYACSDLFTFPSTTDTFGMVVLESLACGLPALVSAVGGPREIVRDQINGFVLPVSDPGVWSDKILEIIEMIQEKDPAYALMCERAREHVMEHYCWDEALNDILDGPEWDTPSAREIKTGRYEILPVKTTLGHQEKESAVA